jgi:hypothetical protein
MPMFLMLPKTLPQIGAKTEIQLLTSGTLQYVEVIHNVDSEDAGLTAYHNLSALVTCHTLYVVLTTWQSAVFLLNSRLTHFTATPHHFGDQSLGRLLVPGIFDSLLELSHCIAVIF